MVLPLLRRGQERKAGAAEHLWSYFDYLSFGGVNPDGTTAKPVSQGYMRLYSAVMRGAFRFTVFPKRLMTYNPMQYVRIRRKQESQELFSEDEGGGEVPTITHEQYLALTDFLEKKSNPALLPSRSPTLHRATHCFPRALCS